MGVGVGVDVDVGVSTTTRVGVKVGSGTVVGFGKAKMAGGGISGKENNLAVARVSVGKGFEEDIPCMVSEICGEIRETIFLWPQRGFSWVGCWVDKLSAGRFAISASTSWSSLRFKMPTADRYTRLTHPRKRVNNVANTTNSLEANFLRYGGGIGVVTLLLVKTCQKLFDKVFET